MRGKLYRSIQRVIGMISKEASEDIVNTVSELLQGYRIWILRGQLTVKSPFLTAKFG